MIFFPIKIVYRFKIFTKAAGNIKTTFPAAFSSCHIFKVHFLTQSYTFICRIYGYILLYPLPLIYVIYDRPAMTVRMDFLFCDLQSVFHEVQMTYITQPDP